MPEQEPLPGFMDFEALAEEQPAQPQMRQLLSVAVMRQAVKESLPPGDPLNDYVDIVLPRLAERFVLVAAKGGAFVEKQRAEGKAESTLARYDRDQSLFSHVLNGLLPVARIIRHLQAHKAPQFRRFDDRAYRLFCIGYTLHDIDKVPTVRAQLDNGKLTLAENKPRFLALLAEQMEELGLAEFFNPVDSTAYQTYLADVAYIIANTQEVWGTYRQTFDLDVQLADPPGILTTLCDLSQLADHLSYLTPSPRDTASGQGYHLLLEKLSDHTVQFVYHAVAENRGILTNVINSAAIRQMAASKCCIPLLFAPNGVVYLAPSEGYAPPTVEMIAGATVDKLKTICREQVESSLVGFGIDRMKRNLKEADFYKLLFSPVERLKLGAKVVDRRGRPQVFSKILDKLPEGVTFPEATTRREADMIAKFCHYVGRVLEVGDEAVLEVFGLSATTLRQEIISLSEVDSSGGTIYRWYRAAAGYLETNPGLSAEDGSLQRHLESKIEQLAALASADAGVDKWTTLRRYVCDVTTVGWHTHVRPGDSKTPYIFKERGAAERHDFNQERVRYETAKESGKAPCSLCALPYEVQEQAETGVLFGPQVYTGRQVLHGSKLKRNICAVCRVEQLLRMVLMQNVDVQGKEFEDKRKVRYVYIYPSYFFTTETLSFVRKMVTYLQGFKFTDVKRQLVPDGSYRVEWEQAAYQQLQDLLLKPPSRLTDELDEPEESGEETEEKRAVETEKGRYILPAYPEDEPLTFLFFGIPHRKPPKREVTDTETWVTPTFLGLALPMALDAKVVVSASPVPLFVSGADFPETVILDAPNPFVQSVLAPSRVRNSHLLTTDCAHASQTVPFNFPRFRLDDLLPSLQTLTAVYAIHLDAHADTSPKDYYRWGEFSKVAASFATSPLYAFHYLDKLTCALKQDNCGYDKACLYIQYVEYFLKGGYEAMSIPRELTERYRAFYRAPYPLKSNGVLKPIAEAADVLLKADKRLFDDAGLKEAIVGALSALMERVHRKHAEGRPNPELWSTGSDGKRHFDYNVERTNIIAFVDYFVGNVFAEALRHDRAALAGRQLNLLKNACEAVYLSLEARSKTPPPADDETEENGDEKR